MAKEAIYRLGIVSDIPRLQQLGLAAYGQFKDLLGEANWKMMEANHKNEETYSNLLSISRCFVCECDNNIVGMAFLIPHGHPTEIFDKEWAYIRLIGVHPDYAGQGIGKTLTRQCIDYAVETDEQTIALHTSSFQDSARHIYESLGFVMEKELKPIYDRTYYLYKLSLVKKENPLCFRRATLNDVPIIVEHRLLFSKELSGDQPQSVTDLLRKQLSDYFFISAQEGTCISIIATCNGEVAGIGSVHIRNMPGNYKNLSGKWGYIMNMYTLPTYRRKGICKGILSTLVEEASKLGVTAFELHATKDGEMVYRDNGFAIFNEPTYRKYLK